MGRGVFRKIIKQPVGAEQLEKKDARADAHSKDTEGAVDAENGTATTNAGSPLGMGDNLAMPTAPTDADRGGTKRPEGCDPLSPDVSWGLQSSPDRQTAPGNSGDSRERPAASSGRPEVYGDVEVCRLLKIRRRKIAEARTKATRGIDWDCVGLHAGMTKKWIQETAIKQGIVPDFFKVQLTPIKEGDGICSCKLLGTWPNRMKVTVEVVATGEAKVATVRDANEFHLYDIFDAKDYGREIQWTAELNNATY